MIIINFICTAPFFQLQSAYEGIKTIQDYSGYRMWSWEGWTKETLATSPDLSVPRLPSAVHSLLKSAFNTVAIEKEKIKQILSDQDQSDQSAQISSLRKSLSQVAKLSKSSYCVLVCCWGVLLLRCIMTLNGGMHPETETIIVLLKLQLIQSSRANYCV